MPDLSTLDETQPPDSEVVALGAGRIRETRDAVKTSFDAEHALSGEHTLVRTSIAGRPSPTHENHVIVNYERQFEQAVGGAWNLLRAVKSGRTFAGAASVHPPGVGFQTIISATISASLGSFALMFFRCTMLVPVAGSDQQLLAIGRFHLNNVNLVDPGAGRSFGFTNSGSTWSSWPYEDFGMFNLGPGLAEGNHTLDYRIQFSLALGNVQLMNKEIIVLYI